MNYKSSKLKKLEDSRFSLFTRDLDRCIVCRCATDDLNEVFMGRNRINSMKYGMVIPLCRFHHEQYHIDRGMQLYWMQKGKEMFIQKYGEDEWLNTFRYIKE